MLVAFPLSQMVIAVAMVVSPLVEATLSSGVLPSTPITAPGTAPCTTTIAVFTGTTASSPLAPLFVASGIDYLSILWARLTGGRRLKNIALI